jgi:hypothetical protein
MGPDEALFERGYHGIGLERVVRGAYSIQARLTGDQLQKHPTIVTTAAGLNYLRILDCEWRESSRPLLVLLLRVQVHKGC